MISYCKLQTELTRVHEELMRMMVDGEEDTLAFHRMHAVFQALAWVDDPAHFSKPFEKLVGNDIRRPRDRLHSRIN